MTPPISACAGIPTASTVASAEGSAGAAVAHRATQVRDRDRGQHEGQHPVAELDRAVQTELAVRHERLVGARGQVGQPEPGAGQPHGAAGDAR